MRSPMVTYRSSSKVLSSPSVERPTARVTAHRNRNITAARITISTVTPPGGEGSRQQAGAVVDPDGGGPLLEQSDTRRLALLAGRLDVGVVVDDERVPRWCGEGQVERVPVAGLVRRLGMEPLGLEDVEVVPGDSQ